MGIVLAWIIFCAVAGFVGSDRECGFGKAFFVSFFFSPIIGLIYAFASTKNSTIEFQNRMMGKSEPVIQQKPLYNPDPETIDQINKETHRKVLIILVVAAILAIWAYWFQSQGYRF